MEGTIAIGRLAEPEEAGEVVAILFDDRSSYIGGDNVINLTWEDMTSCCPFVFLREK